jgi:hypothetical protein
MRTMFAAVVAAAVLGMTAMAPTGAAAAEAVDQALTKAYPGESYAQYGRRVYGGPRYYGRPRYYRGGGGAGAAAGLAAGIAAGALIGGALAAPPAGSAAAPLPRTQDPDFIAYCSRKYRSFDPQSGMFLARDGNWYPCEGEF